MERAELKLDFRFADEMDGLELVTFVNEVYRIESDPSSTLSFRKGSSKLSIEEVHHSQLLCRMPELMCVCVFRWRATSQLWLHVGSCWKHLHPKK
jgi:hypothetical protein